MTKLKKEAKRTKFPVDIECWCCGSEFLAVLSDFVWKHIGPYETTTGAQCPACGAWNGHGLDHFSTKEVRLSQSGPVVAFFARMFG